MERLAFDVLSAFILLATALLGAFLPKHLDSHGSMHPDSKAAYWYHLGNMLSAGVMLSAGFCHLLADSLRHLSFIGHFPIATFLAALGYLVTLMADQAVHMLMEADSSSAGPGGGGGGGLLGGGGGPGGGAAYSRLGGRSSPPPPPGVCEGASPPRTLPGSPVSPARMRRPHSSLALGGGSGSERCNGGGGEGMQLAVLALTEADNAWQQPAAGASPALAAAGSVGQPQHQQPGGGDGRPGHLQLSIPNGGASRGGSPRSSSKPAPRRAPSRQQHLPQPHQQQHHLHAHCHGHIHDSPFEQLLESDLEMSVAPHNHFQVLLSNKRLSFATALLLAGALCIHSILEGMALGAQPTLRGTEDIFLAIVAHKGLAAYALGASIVETRASNAKFWTTIGLFALATPAGIFLGYAFAQRGGGGVGAAVSALAAGTFMYVALMEVIPKELEDGRARGAKMVAMLVGFSLMSLLAVWA